MNNQEKLLYLRGVSAEYFSYSGDLLRVPWQDRLSLLREVGDDPDDESAVAAAIYELDAKPWLSWLQPVHIVSKGVSDFVDIRVSPSQYEQTFYWKVEAENKEASDAIDGMSGSFISAHLPEVGDYYLDSIRYSARRLSLPTLPIGYHQLIIESEGQQQQARLIVAPNRCFEYGSHNGIDSHTHNDIHNERGNNKRMHGINCQVYTLRSERNWGIGDFTDLKELVGCAADAGMDVISINPMHAPRTEGMEIASPYSPSDRRFLNPLYIDPQIESDFMNSAAMDLVGEAQFQIQVANLRGAPMVDYEAVATLKYGIYDRMFQYFLEQEIANHSEKAQQFQSYVERRGEALVGFADFEAQHFGLSLDHSTDPRFHQYLQWLADVQLADCQHYAKARGMAMGLMKDLAIGAVREGAEVQNNRALFCENATIGAPPDPLAEQGQNWNLPALDPIALKQSKYQLYIDLLRANMSACGGLRVDHILGLLRFWWCHPKLETGAYVYYPMDDLLAILCLESHLHQCAIFGEDMGTVPDELRKAMAMKSIHGNKVFYYERNHDLTFQQPESHRQEALLMVTNHDVPTLAGWWNGSDLDIRRDIGLMNDDEEHRRYVDQRQQDKRLLLSWLTSLQLLPDSWRTNDVGNSPDVIQNDQINRSLDFALCSAIILANAKSHCSTMLFQLDDLQLLEDPVNIPGTYKEYPNWRRKQTRTIQALFKDPQVQALLASLSSERSQ